MIFDEMSCRLERVFLLNVLLYVDDLISVKNFLIINKKCQEVGMMLRLYSKRFKCHKEKLVLKSQLKKNEITEYVFNINKIIPKNLFTLFPTIETIECDYNDLFKKELSDLFDQVKVIDLKINKKRFNI